MNRINIPDKWVVVKIQKDGDKPIYKVFATWYGGYLDGDVWKMNSGISEVEKKEIQKTPKDCSSEMVIFKGVSGSLYECGMYEGIYGFSTYSKGVFDNIVKHAEDEGHLIEILPFETDWEKLLD